MTSESNQVSSKIARVQSALKNGAPNSYLGSNSVKSDPAQATKSWGPAMRI